MTTLSTPVNDRGHLAEPQSWNVVVILCDVGVDDFALHCSGHVLLSAGAGHRCHTKTSYLNLGISETQAMSSVDSLISRDS